MRRLFIHLALVLSLAVPLGLPAFASAACPTDPKTDKEQVLYGISGTGADCDGSKVSDLTSSIVNILSIVIGIAAIIVIVISGLRYITSGGDSNKVSSAKNTLIYALIGLVIAALAQLLVHFVLYQSSNVGKPSQSNSSNSSGSNNSTP